MSWRSKLACLGCILAVLGWAWPVAAQQEDWTQLTARFSVLYRQGKFDEALPVAERALRAAESRFGPDHPNVATSLNNLALLYVETGRYGAAEPLYRRAIAIDEKARGPEDAEVATSLCNLAGLYALQARPAAAEPLYLRALKIREQALGPDHPSIGLLLNSLGMLYSDQARYGEAEAAYQRALRIQEKSPGSADLAATLNNLASLYETQGKYVAAEPLMRRALAIAETSLGPQHPSLASALNNLALLCKKQGNYDAAEPLYRRALEIAEKSLGPAHPNVAALLDNLAGLEIARGQYANAAPLYRRALTIREQALGANHPAVAASLNDLASAYRELGQLGSATALLQRALQVLEKTRGPEHPDLAPPLSNLAELYGSQGDYQAAEPLQQRALKIVDQAFGPDHPAIATALNNLAALYENAGRLADAEPLYRRALTMLETALGPQHPGLATPLSNLAGVYLAEEKFTSAEPLYQRALALREKALRPGQPQIAASLNNLAVLYHRQRRYEEAGPLYHRALDIQEKALGPNHPALGLTLRNLGTLQYALQRPAQAEPFLTRALQLLRRQFDQQFTYMSERERLLFLDSVAHVFPLYFSLCFRYREEFPQWAGPMYDVLLWKKGAVAASMAAMRTRIVSSGDPEALALLSRLSARKTELAKLLAAPGEDLAAWRKQVEQLDAEANQLERELVQRSALLGEEQRLGSVTWRDVQKALRGEEAAVELAKFDWHDGQGWTGKTYYVALVLTRAMSSPKLVFVGETRQLTLALRNYRYQAGLERFPVASPANLYEVLWKPFEPLLAKGARVYLSPDSVLNEIPLGTIAGKSGRLLMEDYDLRIVSTTRDLLRAPAARRAASAVLIGNPDFGGSQTPAGTAPRASAREAGEGPLAALPATAVEVDTLRRLLAKQRWDVEVEDGEKASEEALKQVRHPRLLHIATHGFFQPDPGGETGAGRPPVAQDPMLRSGLFLAGANRALAGTLDNAAQEDGVLTSFEATGLDLNGTELVVMSACKTGLGEVKRGEGVFGLRRALEVAGAQSVLMSMWDVPDRETQELMARFYRKWLAGKEKQTALREAQLEMRNLVRSRYGRDLARYWGGFVLVGR